MNIWGIVRSALNLITARYNDNDLKQPNLTLRGNVAVEPILTSAGGSVPALAAVDNNAVPAGQTVALGISETYVFDAAISGGWVRAQTLLDNSDAQAPLGVPALATVARLQGWNGVSFDRLRAAGNGLDAVPVSPFGVLKTNNTPSLFNGTSLDLQRNNVESTLLASAVRAVTTVTPDITSFNHNGIYFFLNITAAPGVDTITLSVEAKDPVSGLYGLITPAWPAKTAIGLFIYVIHAPLGGGPFDGTANVSLPRTFRARITHSALTNFTYSLGSSLST